MFASVFSVPGLRFLPGCFGAYRLHCGIIGLKVLWRTCSAHYWWSMSCNFFIPWRWLNGFILPVLKHGPRSRLLSQVCGWQTCTRNESNGYEFLRCNGRLRSIERGLSFSDKGRTRKMVNYVWVGWSQGKLWWRLVAVLTCKSFVKLEYRGERLIEPSSSWFSPKFPSG